MFDLMIIPKRNVEMSRHLGVADLEKRSSIERGFINGMEALIKEGALPPTVGRRISKKISPKILKFLRKSGLGKKIGQLENLMLAKTRGKRPKHLLERIPASWLRTRAGARKLIRGLKRGGPTRYAVGKALERPSKSGLAGGLIGGLIGLPAPPGIPAAMTLAPAGAVAGSLPQIVRYRRQRIQSPSYRAQLRARAMGEKGRAGAARLREKAQRGSRSLREKVQRGSRSLREKGEAQASKIRQAIDAMKKSVKKRGSK